jgi:hypothetical protein
VRHTDAQRVTFCVIATCPDERHDGVVARTHVARADAILDCAGALIEPGVASRQAIVGIGELDATPVVAVVGRRLLKAGAESGVTEGAIVSLSGGRVFIGPPSGFPAGYIVAGKGDSGALWVTSNTRQPVAMHLGVRTIDGVAVALPIGSAFAGLGVRLP